MKKILLFVMFALYAANVFATLDRAVYNPAWGENRPLEEPLNNRSAQVDLFDYYGSTMRHIDEKFSYLPDLPLEFVFRLKNEQPINLRMDIYIESNENVAKLFNIAAPATPTASLRSTEEKGSISYALARYEPKGDESYTKEEYLSDIYHLAYIDDYCIKVHSSDIVSLGATTKYNNFAGFRFDGMAKHNGVEYPLNGAATVMLVNADTEELLYMHDIDINTFSVNSMMSRTHYEFVKDEENYYLTKNDKGQIVFHAENIYNKNTEKYLVLTNERINRNSQYLYSGTFLQGADFDFMLNDYLPFLGFTAENIVGYAGPEEFGVSPAYEVSKTSWVLQTTEGGDIGTNTVGKDPNKFFVYLFEYDSVAEGEIRVPGSTLKGTYVLVYEIDIVNDIVTSIPQTDAGGVKVYGDGKNVWVSAQGSEYSVDQLKADIYNAGGALVEKGKQIEEQVSLMESSMPSGVYVINVTKDGKPVAKPSKVIYKQ